MRLSENSLKTRRRKIQAVATDLSQAYISALTENLPNAKLVFDHFHVVKLMNEQLTDLRRKLFHEIKDIQQQEALTDLEICNSSNYAYK